MKERRFRVFVANAVIICTLVTVGAISFLTTESTDTVETSNSAIYSGNGNAQAVSLMVNVYEGSEYAVEMAKIIAEYGFKTTFFVGGKWVEKNSNSLIKIYAYGMEIGNHGYLHRDHAKLNYKQNVDEISLCEKLINANLSAFPNFENSRLFAPPSGAYGKETFNACKDLDYRVIMWSKDTIDWRDHDTATIIKRATNDIKAGDLILMHPTECTLAALPGILDYIVSIGLAVKPVSELI